MQRFRISNKWLEIVQFNIKTLNITVILGLKNFKVEIVSVGN